VAEQILGKAFAAVGVMGGHGFFAAAVDVEAAVFPGEQVGEAVGADVLAGAEGLQETDGGEDIRSWKIWCLGSVLQSFNY